MKPLGCAPYPQTRRHPRTAGAADAPHLCTSKRYDPKADELLLGTDAVDVVVKATVARAGQIAAATENSIAVLRADGRHRQIRKISSYQDGWKTWSFREGAGRPKGSRNRAPRKPLPRLSRSRTSTKRKKKAAWNASVLWPQSARVVTPTRVAPSRIHLRARRARTLLQQPRPSMLR
jgi:hypothetical protein